MSDSPRILLVAATPEQQMELSALLAQQGVAVSCVPSLAEATKQAGTGFYRAAWVSADSLFERLSQFLPQLAPLPVMLLYNQYPDENQCLEGLRSGAVDVLAWSMLPHLQGARMKALLALKGDETPNRQAGVPDGNALFDWLSKSMEEIALALAASLDMVEVPNMVLQQLPKVVPYERGSILLREGDALRIVAQRGFPTGWPISEARIAIRAGDVFQQIVESGEALLIDDVTSTPAWQQAEGLPLDRSWLGVPLVSKGQVIGMVSLTRRDVGAFHPEEVSLIRALASQAAVALVNARLLDELKQFNEHLEQLVQERTEELHRAYAKLEKIDQTKTSFISVVAHELRTPLTLVKGYASLLETIIRDNHDASDLISGILTGEKRMLEVVNSMVDVSKIDNRALAVRKSMVSLLVTMKALRSEYQSALDERRISLTFEGLETLPVIQADSELTGKLFRQLIGNAIKYTPDLGTVIVCGKTIHMEDPQAGTKEYVEIQVRDTGIGIDPEHHELIFDKFYQTGPVELHSSGKTKFKGGGPGLGLAIARGIVLAHGGQIWAESPGYDETTFPGSCFHVVLPVE